MTRAALYGVCRWDCAPFLLPDGSLDPVAVSEHARWPVLSLEAAPLLIRPDIVAALRAANPKLKLLAFLNLTQVFPEPHTMDAVRDVRYGMYTALERNNGILWSARDGAMFDPLNPPGARKAWSNFAANLASPAAVAALADVIVKRVHGSGLFDGIIFDWAQHSILWASGPRQVDEIDYRRTASLPGGPVDSATFDALYRGGHRDFVRRMMDAAPSDDWIVNINAGDDDPLEYAHLSGQMIEDPGFDLDPLAAINAVRRREKSCRQPGLNWFNTKPQGGEAWDEHDSSIGFALACAYMTETGVATVSLNGRPDPDGREKRWSALYGIELGNALTPPQADGPGRLVRYFTGGVVRLDTVNKRGRFWTNQEVAP
jgi:hypothetical protein